MLILLWVLSVVAAGVVGFYAGRRARPRPINRAPNAALKAYQDMKNGR